MAEPAILTLLEPVALTDPTDAPPDPTDLDALQIVRELLADPTTKSATREALQSLLAQEPAGPSPLSLTAALEVAVTDAQTRAAYRAATGAPFYGIPSGFEQLDSATGGFTPGTLTMLAAAPGVGKSTLAAQWAYRAAAAGGVRVLHATNEIVAGAVVSKHLARLGARQGVTAAALRDGNATAPAVKNAAAMMVAQLEDRLTFLEGTAAASLLHIQAATHTLRSDHPGDRLLIVVDYLQPLGRGLVGTVAGDLRTATSYVADGLAQLARDTGAAIIAVSSVARGSYQSVGLASGKESGDIEFAADVLLGLQLEDGRDAPVPPRGSVGLSLRVLKSRWGSTAAIPLGFDGMAQTMTPLE